MKKNENIEKILDKLNFEGNDVVLDGKVVYSVPNRPTKSEINLLGVTQDENTIYVGSGQCCYGPITILKVTKDDGKISKIYLDAFRLPDFNTYDIIPVEVDYDKMEFSNSDAILCTGFGCAGAGVRLISESSPKTIDVVSEEEFDKMRKDIIEMKRYNNFVLPRLNVNEEEGTISLDLKSSGTYMKKSKDLTSRLNELGVNIKKTIEKNKGYTRIRN